MVLAMMTKVTTTRHASLEDAKQIREIYMPYILDTIYNLDVLIPTVEELKERIHNASPKYPFLVAEYDNEVIGFIYASKFYDYGFKDACLLSIYVSNKTKVSGVGTLMYAHFEALLISNGTHYIISSIVEENQRSIKFHQKQNFAEFVRLPQFAVKHQCFYNIVWMAKCLESAIEYIYLPSLISEQVVLIS